MEIIKCVINYLFNVVKEILHWLNNNQGIGIFLVIPLAILSDKIISYSKAKKNRKELKIMLLNELWHNVNYVSSIENTYLKNKKDKIIIHIPFPPRTVIIENYFKYELIGCLDKEEMRGIVEIFAQIKNLETEYEAWRNIITINTNILNDEKLYDAISNPVLCYIEPLMRNMLLLWLKLVTELGKESNIRQIRNLYEIINKKMSENKKLTVTYKASYCNKNSNEFEKYDVVFCWLKDWDDSKKEIIEIKNTVALHDSWKN